MEKQLGKIKYQVVHTIRGRIRIAIPRLRTDSGYANRLKQLLELLDFVTSIRINPLARSIIVYYEATLVDSDAVQEQLADCIQQAAIDLNPVEPVSVLVTTEPEVDLATSAIADDLHLPASNTETEEANLAVPAAILPPTTSIAKASTATVQAEISSEANTRLKQHDLAKRLKVATQALTSQRTKPNFADWSKVRDPEGIAWKYDRTSKSFYPI